MATRVAIAEAVTVEAVTVETETAEAAAAETVTAETVTANVRRRNAASRPEIVIERGAETRAIGTTRIAATPLRTRTPARAIRSVIRNHTVRTAWWFMMSVVTENLSLTITSMETS